MNQIGLALYALVSILFCFLVSVFVYDMAENAVNKGNHASIVLQVFLLTMMGSMAYGLWIYV